MPVTVAKTDKLLLSLPGVVAGLSYGMPSYLVGGRFFARFRDDDTVLVLQLASIDERDVLINLNPKAFFFTDHYRNYPAVLIRLAKIPAGLFATVVDEAHAVAIAKPAKRPPKRR